MGITLQHADIIVREHKFRSLPRTVHLLGRQTVLFTYEQALTLLSKHKLRPVETKIELDKRTRGAVVTEQHFITDTTFFGLLGITDVRAIDHSDYEGADIIVDLNQPIPQHLAGSVDFIFGGSVLDNIFDPAMYIKNLARLLRPGGRLVDQNIGSFHHHAYVLVSPAWLLDFFVLNKFCDCKVYLLQAGAIWHVYGLVVDPGDEFTSDFGCAPVSLTFGTVVIAEKGNDSSWNSIPSQDVYRSAEEWKTYRSNLREINNSGRPYWIFSQPTSEDVTKVPIRHTKSFKYLGVFNVFAEDGQYNDLMDSIYPEPSQTGIQVIEASYGLNILTKPQAYPGVMPVCRGNVTELLAGLLNGRDRIELTVDVGYLGDPAPRLPKDLTVVYYHLDDPNKRVRQVYVPAEAHGKRLVIPSL
jgi:hypothetical protein